MGSGAAGRWAAADAIAVADGADPRLDDYRNLRDATLRRAGAVVVEGVVAIRALRASGRAVRSVLLSPARAASLDGTDDLAGLGAPVYVAPRAVLEAVAGFDVHRGALAAAERGPALDPAGLVAGARRLLVAEEVSDTENVGSLFRNAAAFGVDAVLLCPRCADPLSRRSVRVSAGHSLRVPFARLEDWPAALGRLAGEGVTVAALTPAADAVELDRAGLHRIERLALLVGAEGAGLSAGAQAAAGLRVRVAMAPGVDSLNVATAAAVALHAARPRPGRPGAPMP